MIRYITILFFVIMMNSVLFAQQKADSAVKPANVTRAFELSAGYSMVMGSYAALDKTNDKAGYASNGWHVQLNYSRVGRHNFGIALQYTYQNNPLNDSASNIVPNGWSSGTLGPGSWSNHYLMLGPVFMKSYGKIVLDAKILGGAIVSSSDNFTTPDPTDTTGLDKDENLGFGFGYGISVGAGYAFSSHFMIKLNVNLTGGWPGINREYAAQYLGTRSYRDPVTGVISYKPFYSAPVEYDIKKVVTTFSPSLGLVYRF